jgi:hypothetical protein
MGAGAATDQELGEGDEGFAVQEELRNHTSCPSPQPSTLPLRIQASTALPRAISLAPSSPSVNFAPSPQLLTFPLAFKHQLSLHPSTRTPRPRA